MFDLGCFWSLNQLNISRIAKKSELCCLFRFKSVQKSLY